MSAHTPGRLVYTTRSHAAADLVTEKTGRWIATIPRFSDSEANARRLAACWNACEGLDTGALERIGDNFIKPMVDMTDQRDQAITERDQLRRELAAARALLREVLTADITTMAKSGQSIDDGVSGAALTDRISNYLDACDTLEGGAA